jgi:hypothetical protein
VLGKHNSNFDTSEFPFSYIDAKRNKSELIPALNLFTVGTIRDSQKWPKRDKRKDPEKLDLIHFELFSPFIVQKMIHGSKTLKKLKENASRDQEYVAYKGVHIPRLILRTAQKYYEIAIKTYLGAQIADRLEQSKATTFEELKKELAPDSDQGKGKWVDASGMFAPYSEMERLCQQVKSGSVSSVEALSREMKSIYDNYPAYSWTWCTEAIEERLGIPFTEITKEHLHTLLSDWKEQAKKMNDMIINDAGKEYTSNSKIGFGIDGDETTRDKDFEAVRGTLEENSFVQGLQSENQAIDKKAEELMDKLKGM